MAKVPRRRILVADEEENAFRAIGLKPRTSSDSNRLSHGALSSKSLQAAPSCVPAPLKAPSGKLVEVDEDLAQISFVYNGTVVNTSSGIDLGCFSNSKEDLLHFFKLLTAVTGSVRNHLCLDSGEEAVRKKKKSKRSKKKETDVPTKSFAEDLAETLAEDQEALDDDAALLTSTIFEERRTCHEAAFLDDLKEAPPSIQKIRMSQLLDDDDKAATDYDEDDELLLGPRNVVVQKKLEDTPNHLLRRDPVAEVLQWTAKRLNLLTVPELRTLLRDHGLPSSGVKLNLIARLLQHQDQVKLQCEREGNRQLTQAVNWTPPSTTSSPAMLTEPQQLGGSKKFTLNNQVPVLHDTQAVHDQLVGGFRLSNLPSSGNVSEHRGSAHSKRDYDAVSATDPMDAAMDDRDGSLSAGRPSEPVSVTKVVTSLFGFAKRAVSAAVGGGTSQIEQLVPADGEPSDNEPSDDPPDPLSSREASSKRSSFSKRTSHRSSKSSVKSRHSMEVFDAEGRATPKDSVRQHPRQSSISARQSTEDDVRSLKSATSHSARHSVTSTRWSTQVPPRDSHQQPAAQAAGSNALSVNRQVRQPFSTCQAQSPKPKMPMQSPSNARTPKSLPNQHNTPNRQMVHKAMTKASPFSPSSSKSRTAHREPLSSVKRKPLQSPKGATSIVRVPLTPKASTPMHRSISRRPAMVSPSSSRRPMPSSPCVRSVSRPAGPL